MHDIPGENAPKGTHPVVRRVLDVHTDHLVCVIKDKGGVVELCRQTASSIIFSLSKLFLSLQECQHLRSMSEYVACAPYY